MVPGSCSVFQGGPPSAPGPLALVTDLGGTLSMTWLSTPDWVLQLSYLQYPDMQLVIYLSPDRPDP
jgi:hypothetical protein